MSDKWNKILLGILITFGILFAISWIFEHFITPFILSVQETAQGIIDGVQMVVGAIILGVFFGI